MERTGKNIIQTKYSVYTLIEIVQAEYGKRGFGKRWNLRRYLADARALLSSYIEPGVKQKCGLLILF